MPGNHLSCPIPWVNLDQKYFLKILKILKNIAASVGLHGTSREDIMMLETFPLIEPKNRHIHHMYVLSQHQVWA